MDNNILNLNNKSYSNYNNILLEVVNKLENIINDLKNKKQVNIIIKQIRNIVIIVNNLINEKKKDIGRYK